MRILYTGPFNHLSATEFYKDAMIGLGHEVIKFNFLPYLDIKPFILKRLQWNFLIGPNINAYNKDLIALAEKSQPNFVFIDQANYLHPKTISTLKKTSERIIHYTSEYLGYKGYRYRHLFNAASLYDTHIITNSLNIPILKAHGGKHIIRTDFSYNPSFHVQPDLTPEDKEKYNADVVFIGHWEPPREEIIHALRENGINVKVWGDNWEKAKRLSDREQIKVVRGNEYIKALAAPKICLGLLSKWNKNQSTLRTFEIPAIGGFMLAERTEEHLSYFEEGKEADFFSSTDELVSKVKYYLSHENERISIAQAGKNRCLSSGYTYKDRVKEMLEITQTK